MARIRSLKPEAFESETLASVSLAAERTFFGMSTIVDDRGRIADKPAVINGRLWSMRGNHSTEELEGELVELVKEDALCRYTGCDGRRYVHLVHWDGHQKIDRPSKSRLPRCPFHQVTNDYCGLHEDDCKVHETPAQSPASSRALDASSRDSDEGSMQDLGSRTLDRGSVDRGSRTEDRATGATLPGTTLVEVYLAKTTPRPPKEDVRKLTEVVDRLVAEKTPVDVIAEALERYREKTRYPPTLVRNLAEDVVKDRADAAAGKPARGSPKRHQAYQNPKDQNVYDEELQP